ncbi:MAG: 50S ribosomal protein L25 [Verrucomicrobiia bacterium]|jgi:large subunit ribosomal protein L25
MQQVALKANYRKTTRRGEVKKLRATGVVPGVVYGAHTKPVSVEVSGKELGKVLHSSTSENVLVELDLAGGAAADKRLAMVQDVQHDHLTGTVLHVDFHELKSDEKFTARVPVHAVGEPSGVKNSGGVLEFAMRYMHLRCLPKDLPEQISVDVTKLEIGQTIHVGEVALPAGVETIERKDLPVFIVVAPQVEEEVAAPAEGAATEPEVITAKKVEGEEGAAEEGKGEKPKGKAEAGKAEAGKGEAKPDAKAAKPEAKKK